jgi:beta-lactamase regulating signal transducer with metallopeptidase domain
MLFDMALKGILLLLVAALIVALLHKASAASRHLVWLLAIAGLIAVPLLSQMLPEWRIAIHDTWIVADKANNSSTTPEVISLASTVISEIEPAISDPPPEATASTMQLEAASVALEAGRTLDRGDGTDFETASVPGAKDAASEATITQPTIDFNTFAHLLVSVWLIGAICCSAVPIVGLMLAIRLRANAVRVEDKSWQAQLQVLQQELNLSRRVRLLTSPLTNMPLTWGAIQPVILLPQESAEWTASRRRMVLLHELAHVKRNDWVTQLLSQFSCALHWFNPLVWWAARSMHFEQEQASDDLVLAAGTAATEYAAELLHFANRLRAISAMRLAAVPMARMSSFERRVRNLLDPTRRRNVVTRLAICLASMLGCCILIPLAMLRAEVGFQRPHPELSVSMVDPKTVEVTASDVTISRNKAHNPIGDQKTVTGIPVTFKLVDKRGRPVAGRTKISGSPFGHFHKIRLSRHSDQHGLADFGKLPEGNYRASIELYDPHQQARHDFIVGIDHPSTHNIVCPVDGAPTVDVQFRIRKPTDLADVPLYYVAKVTYASWKVKHEFHGLAWTQTRESNSGPYLLIGPNGDVLGEVHTADVAKREERFLAISTAPKGQIDKGLELLPVPNLYRQDFRLWLHAYEPINTEHLTADVVPALRLASTQWSYKRHFEAVAGQEMTCEVEEVDAAQFWESVRKQRKGRENAN